tara:strand:- start:721 stop:1344 length:624 start_codon:yes stop_codon:yes gene_type:complete
MTFLPEVINWLVNLIDSLGYFGVFIGMAIESSFFPFPSEIILPPAGVLIARGDMLFSVVILLAILGSLLGALINYALAVHFGRKVVNKLLTKYQRVLFIKKEHIEKSEDYFRKHGEITTFSGRLIPAVRQIISLPAGFARMSLSRFIIFTALGSSIWSGILIYLGFLYGENQQAIDTILGPLTAIIIVSIILIIILYILFKRNHSKP